MTKEKFDEIVTKCWDACNEASGENLDVSEATLDYDYYKYVDETSVWNDTVFDFKEAILSYKEMYEDFDYEEEYVRLSDIFSDILR